MFDPVGTNGDSVAKGEASPGLGLGLGKGDVRGDPRLDVERPFPLPLRDLGEVYLVREKKTDKLYAMKGEFVSLGVEHSPSSRRPLIIIIFAP